MAYDNCSECEHHQKESCPFAGRSERLKHQVCPLIRLRLIDYNDTPKEPKDCLKCPRRGTSKCAFLNRDYKAKCNCLWVLSEGHNAYDVDLMANRLLTRIDAISKLFNPQQPMDYNRDDTGAIANRFDPNLN